jgi:hypothetical protein
MLGVLRSEWLGLYSNSGPDKPRGCVFFFEQLGAGRSRASRPNGVRSLGRPARKRRGPSTDSTSFARRNQPLSSRRHLRNWDRKAVSQCLHPFANRSRMIGSHEAMTSPMESPQDSFRSQFDNVDGGTSCNRSLTIRVHNNLRRVDPGPALRTNPGPARRTKPGPARRTKPGRPPNEPRSGAERTQERRRTNPISAGSSGRVARTNVGFWRELGSRTEIGKGGPETNARPGESDEAEARWHKGSCVTKRSQW